MNVPGHNSAVCESLTPALDCVKHGCRWRFQRAAWRWHDGHDVWRKGGKLHTFNDMLISKIYQPYFLFLSQCGLIWRWTWRTEWRRTRGKRLGSTACSHRLKVSARWGYTGSMWVSSSQKHKESFAVCLHGMFHVIEMYAPLGDSVRWKATDLLPGIHHEIRRPRHTVHRPCEWHHIRRDCGVDYQLRAYRGRSGVYLHHQKSDRGNWGGTHKAESVW